MSYVVSAASQLLRCRVEYLDVRSADAVLPAASRTSDCTLFYVSGLYIQIHIMHGKHDKLVVRRDAGERIWHLLKCTQFRLERLQMWLNKNHNREGGGAPTVISKVLAENPFPSESLTPEQ